MSIERSGNWNPGGGQKLEVLPCPAVVGPLRTSSPSSYELAEGWAWSSIYCTQETLEYECTETKTDNGTIYTHTIRGYVPDDNATQSAELQRLTQNGRVLARFADNAPDVVRVVGLPAEGLEFDYSLTTDKFVAGDRGYTLSLTGTTTQPCQYE